MEPLKYYDALAVESSRIHGLGVFAREELPARTAIALYWGVPDDTHDDSNLRVEDTNLRLDAYGVHNITYRGRRYRNKGVYINSARGTAHKNNVQFKRIWDLGAHGPAECVEVRTLRRIQPGEELLADYGDGFWDT